MERNRFCYRDSVRNFNKWFTDFLGPDELANNVSKQNQYSN
jgi:hypothetical protein